MGRERRRGAEGGLGLELTGMGTLYHYLLTGQTDKWKNRHMDKQTARERSRTQGSLFYFTTGNVTDTIKMGGSGAGKTPCPHEGDSGEAKSTSSVRPEGGRPEWQSGGGAGRHRSPHPILSKVRFLSVTKGPGGLAGLTGGSGFFSVLGI